MVVSVDTLSLKRSQAELLSLQKEHKIGFHNNITPMLDRTMPGITTPVHTINVIQDGSVKSATAVSTLLSNASTTVTTTITKELNKHLSTQQIYTTNNSTQTKPMKLTSK